MNVRSPLTFPTKPASRKHLKIKKELTVDPRQTDAGTVSVVTKIYFDEN